MHLGVGLIAGLAIGIMSFTGAALTFEKDILAWAERDARRIPLPTPEAVRIGLDELMGRVLAARPELRLFNVTVSADPRDAVIVGIPANAAVAVNPYSGEIRDVPAPRTLAFIQAMRAWHFRLNFKAGPGNTGAMLN